MKLLNVVAFYEIVKASQLLSLTEIMSRVSQHLLPKNILLSPSMKREHRMTYKDHALSEFQLLGWLDSEDGMQKTVCQNVLDLLDVFGDQGHSGSSAPYVMNLFKELAMFKPISPLTGEASEWNEVGHGLFQNKRCSEVFKDDTQAYWISGEIFRSPDGCTYTSSDSRVPVEFPWTMPEPEIIDVEE